MTQITDAQLEQWAALAEPISRSSITASGESKFSVMDLASHVVRLVDEVRRLRVEKAHTPTDDEREALDQIVREHAGWWPETRDAILARYARRSVVPEPSSEQKTEWPDHWTTNEKLRDLHARWHDQPGNLIEVCEWSGCEFWEAAKFALRLADVRVIGREPQGEPFPQVLSDWFTSSHGVAVAAVAPMTDRGPSVMVDGHVISPNDVAALIEFKAQGEPSDAQVDAVAVAIAKAANADYWTDEIAEWENAESWYRDAYPNEHPHAAYEDRDEFRKQARAALRAASAVTEQGEDR